MLDSSRAPSVSVSNPPPPGPRWFCVVPSVHSRTSIDPSENPYYGVFAGVLQQLDRKIDLQIFPAGTDGRYLREVGVPVLGFSPIRLQPVLLHDHDERLSVECYLEGVRVYEKLIPALANMQR